MVMFIWGLCPRRCDLRIISDANQFFIETILKRHGLLGCFSEIVTNPAFVDAEGRLNIVPFHDSASSPHGCNLCPSNMCKVMEQWFSPWTLLLHICDSRVYVLPKFWCIYCQWPNCFLAGQYILLCAFVDLWSIFELWGFTWKEEAVCLTFKLCLRPYCFRAACREIWASWGTMMRVPCSLLRGICAWIFNVHFRSMKNVDGI